jgi:hypothetical protein
VLVCLGFCRTFMPTSVQSADRPARNLTPFNIHRRTHEILLEDARAMKAMGLSPNTPVVDGGKLHERSKKIIDDMLKAALRCQSAVLRISPIRI